MSGLVGNPFLLASAAGGATGYQIERSLRFNSSDSAYLSRTPASAGNRKTFTFSTWVKLCNTNNTQNFLNAGDNSTVGRSIFRYSSEKFGLIASAIGGTTAADVTTDAVFRDFSAWYHLLWAVDTTQATSTNRVKLWVNGVAQQLTFTTAPDLDGVFSINNNSAHRIGRAVYTSGQFPDYYLADCFLIDGQALTASSFTEVSATTGQLIPKAYTGSFGTNGFWLKFSDNSAATATTLGKDYSGNSNNWTPNNLSVSAGAGNDSLVDTPTSYGTDTGAGGEVRGNYATFNPVAAGLGTLSNGNLDVAAAGSHGTRNATIGVSSGKWYSEFNLPTAAVCGLGITSRNTAYATWPDNTAGNYWFYFDGGTKYFYPGGGTQATSIGAPATGIWKIALDLDSGKCWLGTGSIWYDSAWNQTGNPATGANPTFSSLPAATYFMFAETQIGTSWQANFGQRPWGQTCPSGFKALCDTNLPAPVVAKPSSAFDCVTYTGTGATLTPTSSLGFSPDLVWIKSRSAATDHTIYDAVRGTQARLESNNTDPEVTSDGGLTAFNSNGFTLGTLAQVNTNAATYVAWCWDEAVADGFDIVTYTGNGANRTIAHSLGVAPSFMIVKQRTAASATNWAVWHSLLANTEYLLLNSTAAKATGATYWNSTSPTSTNFSLGTAADVNTNNGTYVAYLWSSVVGYTSAGSYTGNGSADGPFVYTSMRPRWILLKRTDSTGNWTILDTAREGYNVDNDPLFPNLADAEGTADLADILSNGFKLRSTDASVNASGGTYIYYAISETAFQYSRAR